MGTDLLTKVMLGQTLVLMQMTFLNNVRKVSRLVLSRTSCHIYRRENLEPYLYTCSWSDCPVIEVSSFNRTQLSRCFSSLHLRTETDPVFETL
jgi:hypothetical protein